MVSNPHLSGPRCCSDLIRTPDSTPALHLSVFLKPSWLVPNLGLCSCCLIHLEFSSTRIHTETVTQALVHRPFLGEASLTILSEGILPDSRFQGRSFSGWSFKQPVYHLLQILTDLCICLLTTCLPPDTSSTQTGTINYCLLLYPQHVVGTQLIAGAPNRTYFKKLYILFSK